MSARWLIYLAAAAFVVGVGLLVPFDYAATVVAGVVCLLTFIVLGVFALLTPSRLARVGRNGEFEGEVCVPWLD